MSLLQQICALLASLGNRRPQTRAGLLMLLGVWLHDCPVAITHFLHKDDNLQYLISHIGNPQFTRTIKISHGHQYEGLMFVFGL
jgi:hypothetical protein